MRHGEAEGLRTADAERALTQRGREQAHQTAQWLKEKGIGRAASYLLCSPYQRARETAAIVADTLGLSPTTIDGVTPDADPRDAHTPIENVLGDNPAPDTTVILVTHMSFVAEFSAWLEEGVLTQGQPFSLAEARILELPVFGPSTGSVKYRYTPNC